MSVWVLLVWVLLQFVLCHNLSLQKKNRFFMQFGFLSQRVFCPNLSFILILVWSHFQFGPNLSFVTFWNFVTLCVIFYQNLRFITICVISKFALHHTLCSITICVVLLLVFNHTLFLSQFGFHHILCFNILYFFFTINHNQWFIMICVSSWFVFHLNFCFITFFFFIKFFSVFGYFL